MPSQEPSLEYILPVLSKLSPEKFIQREQEALQQIVADILFEIGRRKSLEDRLLSNLEKRIMHHHSELMNIQPSYNINNLERTISLEISLERIEIKKIYTQENTQKDILELKKILWHYFILLSKKQTQLNFLQ